MNFNPNDVGQLYTDDQGGAWRLRSYCERPSVALENLETKEVVRGAIDSPILDRFLKLRPEAGDELQAIYDAHAAATDSVLVALKSNPHPTITTAYLANATGLREHVVEEIMFRMGYVNRQRRIEGRQILNVWMKE